MAKLYRHDLTDPESIEANQRGELTQNQRTILNFVTRQGKFRALFSIAFVLFVNYYFITGFFKIISGGTAFELADILRLLIFLIFIYPTYSMFLYLRILITTTNDLRKITIVHTEGEIVIRKVSLFRLERHVAMIGQRRLKPLSSLQIMPLGQYRFSYLPRSHWLLSLEPVTAVNGQDIMSGTVGIIAAQDNDPVDQFPNAASLKANRRGQLTSAQTFILFIALIQQITRSLILLIIPLAFGVLTIYLSLRDKQFDFAILTLLIVFGMLSELIIVLVFIAALRVTKAPFPPFRAIRLAGDIFSSSKIDVTEGKVEKGTTAIAFSGGLYPIKVNEP